MIYCQLSIKKKHGLGFFYKSQARGFRMSTYDAWAYFINAWPLFFLIFIWIFIYTPLIS
jgi:hypothetical protein